MKFVFAVAVLASAVCTQKDFVPRFEEGPRNQMRNKEPNPQHAGKNINLYDDIEITEPRNERPEHNPKKDHQKQKNRPQRKGKEEKHMRNNDPFIVDRKQEINGEIMIDPIQVPFPPPDFEENSPRNKEKHGGDKHMKNKRLMCFAVTALIFTLFGLILGKCIRKCKNKKNKNCQQRRQNLPRTSIVIEGQIKENQEKIRRLKEEYEHVRSQEARRAYEQERAMMQRAQPQFIDRNYQPINYSNNYPSQQYYYNYSRNVPVGRPINKSNNSSFAEEYPTL